MVTIAELDIHGEIIRNYYKYIDSIRPINRREETALLKKYYKWKKINRFISQEILGRDSYNILPTISGNDAAHIFDTVIKEISNGYNLLGTVRQYLGLDITGDTIIENENDIVAVERELERFVFNYRIIDVKNNEKLRTCSVKDLFGCVLGETLNNIAFSDGNHSLINTMAYSTKRSLGEITRTIQKLAICRALVPKSLIELTGEGVSLKTLHLACKNNQLLSNNNWILTEYRPYLRSGDYLITVKNDGMKAMQGMIEEYLSLVVSISENYRYQGLSLLELIEEGNIGLVEAIESYDKYINFKTYVTSAINNAIIVAIKNRLETIRFSVEFVDSVHSLHELKRYYEHRYRRDPTANEISEELEKPLVEVKKLLLFSRLTEAMMQKLEDEVLSMTTVNITPDVPLDIHAITTYDIRETIDTALNSLTARERRVIQLRYGLEDGKARTLEEVGQLYKLTRERIRQIQEKALRRLRHPSRSRLLKDYY